MNLVLVGVAGASVVAGIVLDRLALRMLRPPRRQISLSPGDLGLPAEEIVVDGDVALRVWLIEPSTPAASTVLLVHGWGANASGPIQLAPALVAAGHRVAAVDVRGHGRSDAGPFVTLRHFRDDVARTAAELRRRWPDAQLTVIGHSMGGAAGILVAADGGPVDRLVTVAAPFDVYDATRRYLHRKNLPGNALVGAFRVLWKRRVGVPYDAVHPGIRAADVRVPTLVIQPDRDHQVPLEDGRRLAEAARAPVEVIENSGHSDVLARPEVHDRIARFVSAQFPVDPVA